MDRHPRPYRIVIRRARLWFAAGLLFTLAVEVLLVMGHVYPFVITGPVGCSVVDSDASLGFHLGEPYAQDVERRWIWHDSREWGLHGIMSEARYAAFEEDLPAGRRIVSLPCFRVTLQMVGEPTRSEPLQGSWNFWLHLWLPLVIGAVATALSLRKMLILEMRHRRGLCLYCGYDLRAVPERCSECGTVRDTTAPPVPARKARRIAWKKAAGLAVALILALMALDFATGAYTQESVTMPTRLTVVDAQGRALGGVSVWYSYDFKHDIWPVASGVTDGRGEVLLRLPVRVHHLRQRLLNVVQLNGAHSFIVFHGEAPPPYDDSDAWYKDYIDGYDIDGAIRWLGIGKSPSASHTVVVPPGDLGTPGTPDTGDGETTEPSVETAEPSDQATAAP